MWNPLRRLLARVGRFNTLFLRHHPECTRYSHHTFGLSGQQVCMGCFIVYPVGFISLLSLVIGGVLAPEFALYTLDALALYAAGFALVTPKVAAKLVPGQRAHRTRVVTKTLLAVGLAFVALPFFFHPGARLLTVGLFFGFLLPYVGHKMLTVVDECEGCPYEETFPNCPGMEFDGTVVDPERQYELESRRAQTAAGTGTDQSAASTPDTDTQERAD
jgi:hypothetical protein